MHRLSFTAFVHVVVDGAAVAAVAAAVAAVVAAADVVTADGGRKKVG